MTTFPFAGSVSHATHRPEDLIPVFLHVARAILDHDPRPDEIVWLWQHDFLDNIWKRWACREDYFESQESIHDLDALFNFLDAVAPPGTYFGAHEGDGSDFGFWPIEEE